MKSIVNNILLILAFASACNIVSAGTVGATGGSGPAGTTPTFSLSVNDNGYTAPYGFQFVDVYDMTSYVLVERYVLGPGGSAFYPYSTSFTWTDPRGSSFTGTHSYTFNFAGWSPSTSHYLIGSASASYTIGPVNSPPSISSANANNIAQGDSATVHWIAYDADNNFSNVQVWVNKVGASTSDFIGSSSSIAGSLTWSSGSNVQGTYQFVIQATDSQGATSGYSYAQFSIGPPAVDGVTWNSISLPSAGCVGQLISFSASVRNSGTSTWGGLHFLELKDQEGTHLNYPSISGASPGGDANVTFQLTLPSAPGIYTYGFTALRSGVAYFGGTQYRSIQVSYKPVTALTTNPASSAYKDDQIAITSVTTDADNNLVAQAINYLPPGGTEWLGGYSGQDTRWEGAQTGSNTLAKNLPLTQLGTWQFRARGQDSAGLLSDFSTKSITVTQFFPVPVASFTVSQQSGTAPLNTTFTSNSLGSVSTYAWDFDGNGTIDSTNSSGSYSFSSPGTYNAKLTVTDSSGASTSMVRTIKVLNVTTSATNLYQSSGYISSGSDYDWHDYYFNVPSSGTLRVYTTGSTDTYGYLYNPNGSLLGNNDDNPYPNFSMTFNVTPGVYHVQMRGYSESTEGPYVFNADLQGSAVSEPNPPIATFTASVYTGASPLSVSFDATGSSAPSGSIAGYAWDFDGNGSTDSTAASPSWNYPSAGSYDAKLTITSSNGGTCSMTRTIKAMVSVPNITVQPVALVAAVGDAVVFSVTATGGATLTYQWYKDDVIISGAMNASLSIPNVLAANAGSYKVKISNSAGSIFSDAKVLGVITTQPISQTVVTGARVDFTVAALGGIFTYQWYKDNVVISGATGVTHTIANAQSANQGSYKVRVDMLGAYKNSNAASLTVSSPNPVADSDGDGLTNVAQTNLGGNFNPTAPSGNSTSPTSWPLGLETKANGIYNEVPGAFEGHLSVDRNGAATYTLPLWVVPGTAGMEPRLSLKYSSQSGTGIAGHGWTLGGLSTISRGPQTRFVDGQVKGITFGGADAFYLDGQRLIAVEGENGSHETVYRTEIESFSRIISYGSGPESFTVWNKAGLKLEYGSVNNSTFMPPGASAPLNWHISKVSDTTGNSIEFVYDNETGEMAHISRINYTVRSGTSFASVRFNYGARSDPSKIFIAGATISNTKRLNVIDCYYGENVMRSYKFEYAEDDQTNRTSLTTIRAMAGSCTLPALAFSYEPRSEGAWTSVSSSFPVTNPIAKDNAKTGVGFIDLNGDGFPDYVAKKYGGSNTYNEFSSNILGQSWSTSLSYKLPDVFSLAWENRNDCGTRFVDLNGDGLIDIIFANKESDGSISRYAYLNTGSGWAGACGGGDGVDWRLPSEGIISTPDVRDNGGRFIDINGDGAMDFIWKNSSSAGCFLNNGVGQISPNSSEKWIRDDRWAPKIVVTWSVFVDINGDGLPDQIERVYFNGQGNLDRIGVALNSSNGFQSSGFGEATVTHSYAPINASLLSQTGVDLSQYVPPVPLNEGDVTMPSPSVDLVDINGDGLIDVVSDSGVYYNTGRAWVLSGITINSTMPISIWYSGIRVPAGSAFLDINGDGMVDQVYYVQGGSAKVRYGQTNGLSSPKSYALPYVLALTDKTKATGGDFVDLNGDGVPDQIWSLQNSDGEQIASGASINPSKYSGRLFKVTTGLGVNATISYKPLSDSSIYSRSTPRSSYPIKEIIGPMQVVSRIDYNYNDAGSTYAVSYGYQNLRTHATRGSLGFESIASTDSRTGVVTITSFNNSLSIPLDKAADTGSLFALCGLPDIVESKLGNIVLSYSQNNYEAKRLFGGKTIYTYAKDVIKDSYDLNGNFISGTKTTAIPFDLGDDNNKGNLKTLTVVSRDGTGAETGYKTVTEYTYVGDMVISGKWFIGRPETITVTSIRPAQDATKPDGCALTDDDLSVVRKIKYIYYPDTGLVKDEITEPDRSDALKLETTYQYDSFGNKRSVTITGIGLGESPTESASRTSSVAYDALGRLPVTRTNAKNQTETFYYTNGTYEALGLPTRLRDLNQLDTSWTYDDFGRIISETRTDNTVINTKYRWLTDIEKVQVPGAVYFEEKMATGAAPSAACFNAFGKAQYSLSINGGGPDGDRKMSLVRIDYDSFGRVFQSSIPYFPGETAQIYTRTTSFDAFGRPTSVAHVDDNLTGGSASMDLANTASALVGKAYFSTVFTYDRLTTESKRQRRGGQSGNELDLITRNVRNAQGLVESTSELSAEAGGTVLTERGSVNYIYDALGHARFTRVKKNSSTWSVSSASYDIRGRKTGMTDPDLGTWTYSYNALGELRSRTDAKSQETSFVYDALGRLTSRSEEGASTSWVYDTATKGVGQLQSSTHTANAEESQDGYTFTETYSYDLYGRASGVTHYLDHPAVPAAFATHSFGQTYDTQGRPEKTVYPSNYVIKNWYSGFGFLRQVRDARDGASSSLLNDTAVGMIYWQADAYNRWGGISEATLGNGLSHDTIASELTGRINTVSSAAVIAAGNDSLLPHHISYTYDTLGNVSHRVDERGGRDDTFTFDELNRLKSYQNLANTSVSIAYDLAGNITSKTDVGGYLYENTAHKNAVSSAGGQSYDYDDNGNMTNGAGRSIAWTSYNLPRRIASATAWSEFSYGPSRERVVQKESNGRVTLYLGSNYEVTLANGQPAERRHYIMTPMGRTAVRVESGAEIRTRYLHQDGLGSVVAVSDEWGRVEARNLYDPWGKQGATTIRSQGNGSPLGAWSNPRGYTDHEMLSDLGLVHMNGRVYDQMLGKFLSGDPYVQAAEGSQAYNRYSYVRNKPLQSTDPSGLLDLDPTVGSILNSGFTPNTFDLGSNIFLGSSISYNQSFTIGPDGSLQAGSFLNGGGIGDAFKSGIVGTAAVSNGVTPAGGKTTAEAYIWATAELLLVKGLYAIPNGIGWAFGGGNAPGYEELVNGIFKSEAIDPNSSGGVALDFGTNVAVLLASAKLGSRSAVATEGGEVRQSFATGKEWFDHFAAKYGRQNVEWTSGSGRTISWPSELPRPAISEMLKIKPLPRSYTFTSELESAAGPRPRGGIAHHTQPLGLNGADNGFSNGSWVIESPHIIGHGVLNSQLNTVSYGTWIILNR